MIRGVRLLLEDWMWARQRRARVTVRVWRYVGGEQLWLFTYAGAVDAMLVAAIMDQVRRLTAAVPGPWWVEVIAVGADRPLVNEIRATLGVLAHGGLHTRLAVSPCGSRPRVLAARPSRAFATPPLMH